MSKFINDIRKNGSCYHCGHCCICNEDTEKEFWGCDEIYGVPVGVNPPYDEICDHFIERKDHD